MIQGAAFRVLAGFYDSDSRNFADLCNRAGYPTDLGGYYIRQLLSGDYIQKGSRGQYRILPKGKQQLALIYGKQSLAARLRVSVAIVASQQDRLAVIRRKVQPFIGAVEWPAGVVNAGEEVQTAARRILQARLGIDVPLTLCGFFRRIDRYADTIFDDKFFAVHTCILAPEAELMVGTTIGENLLVSRQELEKLDRPSRSLLDILQYAEQGDNTLQERTYQLTATDLALRDDKHR